MFEPKREMPILDDVSTLYQDSGRMALGLHLQGGRAFAVELDLDKLDLLQAKLTSLRKLATFPPGPIPKKH